MNKRLYANKGLIALAFMALPFTGCAQVPVDDHGNEVGYYKPVETIPDVAAEAPVGNEDIPLLADTELQDLVGPIALYPDDLLAIVLPASAYPLQIVEAGRFLEDLENDPSLEPDPEWDDSVVALLNYPEIIELLNDDIDWTWRLGEAVVAQQDDVVAAIETFRDRAYAAGNLRSDEYQNVTRDDGVIEISPVSDDVIYVPYYEPERVVIYQPRPVYYYYPRAYPVYYYPYPSDYYFRHRHFWGVTTAFSIGWVSDSLSVFHHSYYGHPYYGRSYWDRWYYRRPSINIYNTTYVRNSRVTVNHYYRGDRWRPRHDRRDHIPATRPRTMNYTYQRDRRGVVERQLTRSVEMRRNAETRRTRQTNTTVRANRSRDVNVRTGNSRRVDVPAARTREPRVREPIQFRDRSNEARIERSSRSVRQAKQREPVTRERARPQVQAHRQEPRAVPQARRNDARVQPRVRSGESRREPQVRQRETRPQPQVRRQQARPQPQREVEARQSAVRERARPQAREAAPRPKQEARQPSRENREAKRESRRESRSDSKRRRER